LQTEAVALVKLSNQVMITGVTVVEARIASAVGTPC